MRTRIKFSKTEAMRYIGHLDLFRAWERTFRRSGLPLAYSQGFHPQPRLNLACALPLGFTSQCELVDAWLEQDFLLSEMGSVLSTALPPGLVIQGLEIADPHAPALQTQVASAVYKITFLDPIADLDERIRGILSASQLPRVRRGKSYDLRPLVESIEILPRLELELDGMRLKLAAREAATGRPEELLDEMGICFEATRIHRENLIFF